MDDRAITATLVGEAATRRLGQAVGRLCERGEVVALCGPLGAGKTTLVQGLAEGLDVPPSAGVRSPTFTLCNEYPGRCTLLHIDLYRLGSEEEADDIGFRDRVGTEGVAVVEWADRFPDLFPAHAIWIELQHSGDARRATVWGLDATQLTGDEAWTLVETKPPWERSSSRWS
jgi:tRNA threonylcarbamoyl adenosine modification protein YjeE